MYTGLHSFAIFEDYQEGLVLSCGYNPIKLHLNMIYSNLFYI